MSGDSFWKAVISEHNLLGLQNIFFIVQTINQLAPCFWFSE